MKKKKELERIGSFDFFMVLLATDCPIYRKDGTLWTLGEIANLKFGEVKILHNNAEFQYCKSETPWRG